MQITILAFGIIREIFNGSTITIQIPQNTNVLSLKHILNVKYPALLSLKSYVVALNEAYASDNVLLNPTDEIAIIPPVSGG
jgi:molybdopterin synthase sulfur carrier subunit